MNNFCSIFSKKLLKNCLVFFVVPAILLVACGAADPEGDAGKDNKPVAKLPAESAPATWDKAFEHMLTAIHAPYADGDCFFKAGPVAKGVAAGTPNVMKIMGKNLVVDHSKKLDFPSAGKGYFSITTTSVVAGIKVAAASTTDAGAAVAAVAGGAGVVIEYKDFQPAGSNVTINGKIGLNGIDAVATGNLAMFFTAATQAVNVRKEPTNGGKLVAEGPGYKATLSFEKSKLIATSAVLGNGDINNYVVYAPGKACDGGNPGEAATDATKGLPFQGNTPLGFTGAFAPGDKAAVSERIIVKFKFNSEAEKVLVGHGAIAANKGQELLKKFVKVTKTAPAVVVPA